VWMYEKKLQRPINIKNGDLRMAKTIITQYGGPDGELGAAVRYLSQRYTMPTNESTAVLNDIGTEELGHMEMVSTMVYQLMKNATPAQIKEASLAGYFADHGKGIYPVDGAGVPFSAATLQSLSDPIANLHEDLAAEQKARATYEYLIQLCDDPDVLEPLRFLREREVVHFQRFGEALRQVQDHMSMKKVF
jgi:spore coat protein JC